MQDDTSTNLDLNKREMHRGQYDTHLPWWWNIGSITRDQNKTTATADFKSQKSK